MFKIKSLTAKNFMSVGNVSQGISFDDSDLVLVLGENLDLGGNDSRNGVGKSTIINALSYALYGEAIVKIKKDNLVNKVNSKGMIVTLDFSVDGNEYRIERGRKPNVFRFFANGSLFGEEETEVTNEAQGEARLTQQEVERVIGLSHTMFKQIVALNTYNEPFLSMGANSQREIIEQLLGITKLTEKANKLKEAAREVRDAIKEEEFAIKAKQESNKRIEQNIKSLRLKCAAWDKKKDENISEIQTRLEELYNLNVDNEIAAHKTNSEIAALAAEQAKYTREISALERDYRYYEKQRKEAEKHLRREEVGSETVHTCPTCEQEITQAKSDLLHRKWGEEFSKADNRVKAIEIEIQESKGKLAAVTVPEKISTFYDSVEDAYYHKSVLESLANELEKEMKSENPYLEQVGELKENGLQDVSFETINELNNYREHQDFLLKLLTNKDSFIRKKIIDQNLSYLNSRLSMYLEKVGLPHQVKFRSDLEVEITQYGRDFDFDNLSRGERTRLILSLSWAFRDVYESLNARINLLFIDELIDGGLDTNGVESSLSVLKKMNRENARNVFLISHRDELVGRVTSVLKVTKEGGFTTFESTDTNI